MKKLINRKLITISYILIGTLVLSFVISGCSNELPSKVINNADGQSNESEVIKQTDQQPSIEASDSTYTIHSIYVKDNDQDGIEELYLFFEDFFELQKILVIIPINDSHQLNSVFFGYGESMFEYEDVSQDGVAELISPHPGGGGMTTTWKGLELVNIYTPETLTYDFSYAMT